MKINAFFNFLELEARFKIENTINRNDSKVSNEYIIDAENKKILKVKDGKIYIVRSFTENLYI